MVQGFEKHAVGVEWVNDIGAPDDFDVGWVEAGDYGLIGKVAFACGGQAAVEGDAELLGLRIFRLEDLCSLIGAHCVAA